MLGALVGVVLACAYVVIRFMTDDQINGEEDIAEISDLPVLAAIPELLDSKSGGGYYGYGQGKKGGKA